MARGWLFCSSVGDLQLTQNLLLDALPQDARTRLTAAARVDEVQVAQRIFNEDEPTEVYFPLDSVISLMRTLEDGEMVEVGMIGAEGSVGINAILGVKLNPHTGITQSRGYLVTIPTDVVQKEMARDPRVSDILHHYLYAFYTSVSQRVACNRRHHVVQRLAQWLLTLHDRTGADELSLTHEFLSFMLATRRAGISEAMASLTDAGAIEPRRNRARIVDRAKLESLSCECYRVNCDEYERTLGFPPRAKGRTTPVD